MFFPFLKQKQFFFIVNLQLNRSEGKVIRTLRSHTEFVNTLCVVPNSPDGLLVFTGSGKTIRAFAPLEAQDPELPRFSLEGHEKEGIVLLYSTYYAFL